MRILILDLVLNMDFSPLLQPFHLFWRSTLQQPYSSGYPTVTDQVTSIQWYDSRILT